MQLYCEILWHVRNAAQHLLYACWLAWLAPSGTYGITEKEFVVVFLVKSEPKPCLDKTSSTEIQPVQPAVAPAEASAANSSASGSRLEAVFCSLQDPHFTAISEGFLWFSILTTSCFVFFFLPVCYTSSTAQGGGGSFKNRKPIGEVGCCESGMAERSHWLTERWLELCLLEWLQWLQWSPHPQLLDVVWCTATVVVVVA